MEEAEPKSSKDLLNVDPLARDNKLLINKDIRSLDDIRKSFNKQQNGNSVLEQVRNFLPKMASANAALQRQLEEDPEHSVDIEDIGDDEDAQHIEMNLALVEECDNSSDSVYSSDDDDDDNDDDDCLACNEINENNIKLPMQTKKVDAGKSLVICVDKENDNIDMENMDCADNEKT